jgi:hypothetical protein
MWRRPIVGHMPPNVASAHHLERSLFICQHAKGLHNHVVTDWTARVVASPVRKRSGEKRMSAASLIVSGVMVTPTGSPSTSNINSAGVQSAPKS